jgi:hypothetical protein
MAMMDHVLHYEHEYEQEKKRRQLSAAFQRSMLRDA